MHPQSIYPTYTIKSKYPTYTLMNIINKKKLKSFEKNLNRKIVTKMYMTTTSWST